jgi:hypothetical protein
MTDHEPKSNGSTAPGDTALLEQRIVAALSAATSLDALAALLSETEAAIQSAAGEVERVRERAMDPVEIPNANVARAMIETAEFARERLQSLLPRLRARYVETEADEYARTWSAAYMDARAHRSALAAELRELYPKQIAPLVDLFQRIAAEHEASGVLNREAPPDEHRRLIDIELMARDLDAFSRDQPSILTTCTLPNFDNSAELLWPPRPPPFASLLATPPPFHPGRDWADPKFAEMRAAEIKAEQARLAAYHESQTKLQEERHNAEERARFAASQRRV